MFQSIVYMEKYFMEKYNDNWLLRPDTFKPFSPSTLLENSVVVDLINEENKWDEEKLNQHFLQEDAEVILKIPLPRDQLKDVPCGILIEKGILS